MCNVVELARKTLAPEQVDGAEVRGLHTAQPHEGNVLHEQSLHLSAGIHVV